MSRLECKVGGLPAALFGYSLSDAPREITAVLERAGPERDSWPGWQVVMADADIDQLTARTTDGAVVLNGSARRIDITNDHGDVASRNAISVAESFRTVTETGDVSVDFAAAPAVVDVETGDGDVVLAVPDPGPYAVNASTGEGRGSTVVSVPQTRNREDAASVVTARSETGDVVVEALR